jgi:hypothetical protein
MYQFFAQSVLRHVHSLIQSHSSDSVTKCFLFHTPVSSGPFYFFLRQRVLERRSYAKSDQHS